MLGDASVRFIADNVDIGIIAALVTRNGAGSDDTDADGIIQRDELKEPVLDNVKF